MQVTNESHGQCVVLPQDMVHCSRNRVNGDKYIICTFHLIYGTMVEDSDNDLSLLMSRLPEHLENADDTTCVAEVFEWRVDKTDPTDFIPYAVNTLYQIVHYDNPSETD